MGKDTERYHKRRTEWLVSHGPCERCGSWTDLEIDHVHPELKTTDIIWSLSDERRAVELAKCQVLCHSCHLVKTANDRRPDHGTYSRYNRGCRCHECMAAKNEASRNQYHRSVHLGIHGKQLKLNDDDVRYIRRTNGIVSVKNLAESYGVDRTYIFKIRSGSYRKDIV